MSNELQTIYFELLTNNQQSVRIYRDGLTIWHDDNAELLPTTSAESPIICDDDEHASTTFTQLSRTLETNGYFQCTAPEQRWQQQDAIGEFLSDDIIQAIQALPRRETPIDMVSFIKEAYGINALPAELEAFWNAVSQHDSQYFSLAEWRIFAQDFITLDEDSNWFEQLVLMDQGNYLGTAMFEAFTQSPFIGSAGNGDTYYANCHPLDPQRAEIIFYDHEEHWPSVMAESPAALAMANKLLEECHGFEEEHDDDEEEDYEEYRNTFFEKISARAAPLEDRITFSWHYEQLEENCEFETKYQLKTHGLYTGYRCIWIDYMLRQNGNMTVSDMPDFFFDGIHDTLNYSAVKDLTKVGHFAQPALYWLWHLFWFNKDESLREHITKCKNSPARYVRDAAALVEELQDGRKTLGKIDDIHELRDKFLALDLDPEDAEGRAARQEAAAQAEQEKQAAETALGADVVASTIEPDALKKALWDLPSNTARQAVVDELLKDDALLAARANSNDDLSLEAINSVYAWYTPMLLEDPRDLIGAPLDTTHHAQTIAAICPELVPDGEYNHAFQRRLAALSHYDMADHVDSNILPLLDLMTYDEDTDFAKRFSSKDSLRELMTIIGNYPTAATAQWLINKTAACHPECQPFMLITMGKTAAKFPLPELLTRLRDEFTRRSVTSLYALSLGGDDSDLGMLEALNEQQKGPMPYRIPSLLFTQAMRLRLRGEAVDEAVLNSALQTRLPKERAAIELWQTVIEVLLAQTADDNTLPRLKSLLDVDLMPVRQAAMRAIRSLEPSFVPDYLDAPRIAQLLADEGIDGIRQALLADNVIGRSGLIDFIDQTDDIDHADVEDELLHALVTIARHHHYPSPWKSDEDSFLNRTIRSLQHVNSDRIKMVLAQLIVRPYNPLVANIIDSDNRRNLDSQVQSAMEQRSHVDRPVPATAASWLFGSGINGMAFLQNGELLVAGNHGVVKMNPHGIVVQEYAGMNGCWTYDITIHPDQQRAAASANGTILQLLDIESGRTLVNYTGQSGGIRKAKFSPDGKRLASVSDHRYLCVWDVDSGEMLHQWHDASDVNGVDWLDDERIAIITDVDTQIISFANNADGDRLAQAAGGGAEIHLGPEGKIYAGLMSCSNAGIAVMDQQLNHERTYPQCEVARIRFSNDGQQMFAIDWTGDEQGLWHYDLSTGERTAIDGHSDASPFSMDVHPDTDLPYVGGGKKVVIPFELTEQGYAAIDTEVELHNREVSQIFEVNDVLYSVGGSHIIGWQRHGEKLSQISRMSIDTSREYDAVACNDDASRWLIVQDGWELRDANNTTLRHEHPEGRMETAAFAQGNYAFGIGSTLHIVDIDGNEIAQHPIAVESTWIHWLVASNDYFVACGYEDPILHVFDAKTGAAVGTITLPIASNDRISALDIAKEANQLLVACWKVPTRVYDLTTEGFPQRFEYCVTGNSLPMVVNDKAGRYFFNDNGSYSLLNESLELVCEFDRHQSTGCFYIADDYVVIGTEAGELLIREFDERHQTAASDDGITIVIPDGPKMQAKKLAATADESAGGGFNPFD